MDELKPVVKDGCGIFGVLRKDGASRIGSSTAVRAIECVRYRGSILGAGFASFSAHNGSRPPYRVKVFVDGEYSLGDVRKALFGHSSHGLKVVEERLPGFKHSGNLEVYTAMVEAREDVLYQAVNEVNSLMWKDGHIRGRVYSSGRYVNVYKDVGYPLDVAKKCDLVEDRVFADAWLAHTRQPTNSPGRYPVWSHPFSSFEFAIVHNGDISSFGANMELLNSFGMKSHVGTDSEVIAALLDHLVRVKGLGIEEAARILSNPYERWREGLGMENEAFRKLMIGLRGAQLDGPFSVVGGYCDGHDVYILGLVDRARFRPMVVGEDDGRIYIASEECQIRALSPEARVWTPQPGSFILASINRGVIEPGRRDRGLFMGYHVGTKLTEINFHSSVSRRPLASNGSWINAEGLNYRDLNDLILEEMVKGTREVNVINVGGQRYIGVNLQRTSFFGSRLSIYGYPGNCLANFNSGLEFTVYGNAADDVGDTMHDGRIVVHGDARDVVGQALQGGEIFVRGSVGNRVAMQMREYRDRKPFMIVGGRADDYLGEYMAGGVVVILGLDSREDTAAGTSTTTTTTDRSLVGNFVGTGMVGGKIIIRGNVRKNVIGLPPPRTDVSNYLYSLTLDGLLSNEKYESLCKQEFMSYELLKENLPSSVFEKVKKFYLGKYIKPLSSEFRELDSEESTLMEPKLRSFFRIFRLNEEFFEKVLSSKFTVVSTMEDKQEREDIAEE